MRMNTRFNEKAHDTWMWFMNARFPGIFEDIDTYTHHIAEAAKADYARWRDAPLPDYPGARPVADNSDMAARDSTPSPPLPDCAVGDTGVVSLPESEPATSYFNLQGFPLAAPAKGGPCIMETGGKPTKILSR